MIQDTPVYVIPTNPFKHVRGEISEVVYVVLLFEKQK